MIQKRESVNDPKVYDRLGFKRQFLKAHGETKCFEKAVQFKKEKPRRFKEVSSRYNGSFVDSAREISLEYSSDDYLDGEGLDGWRKVGKEM